MLPAKAQLKANVSLGCFWKVKMQQNETVKYSDKPTHFHFWLKVVLLAGSRPRSTTRTFTVCQGKSELLQVRSLSADPKGWTTSYAALHGSWPLTRTSQRGRCGVPSFSAPRTLRQSTAATRRMLGREYRHSTQPQHRPDAP